MMARSKGGIANVRLPIEPDSERHVQLGAASQAGGLEQTWTINMR